MSLCELGMNDTSVRCSRAELFLERARAEKGKESTERAIASFARKERERERTKKKGRWGRYLFGPATPVIWAKTSITSA